MSQWSASLGKAWSLVWQMSRRNALCFPCFPAQFAAIFPRLLRLAHETSQRCLNWRLCSMSFV